MTEKEFRNLFDSVTCSDTFTQRMESMLSQPQGAAVFSDSVSGVTISQNRSRVRYMALAAACLVLVIGSAAGAALYSRIPSQPAQPPTQETSTTLKTDQPSNTEDAYEYPLKTETVPVAKTTENFQSTESTFVTSESSAETGTASQTTTDTSMQAERLTETHITTEMTEPPTEVQTTILTTTTTLTTELTTVTSTQQTAASTYTTTVRTTLPPGVYTSEIYDYASGLRYDNSPMAVGETREIHYYYPGDPDAPARVTGIYEASGNMSYVVDEANKVIRITATAPGAASMYVMVSGCAFGRYAYLTIIE